MKFFHRLVEERMMTEIKQLVKLKRKKPKEEQREELLYNFQISVQVKAQESDSNIRLKKES